ncbi:MAG: hypothetical protein Q4A62_09740, partial [Eikenella sp.]|nr:hypothetical protein [Eikenella sp.]
QSRPHQRKTAQPQKRLSSAILLFNLPSGRFFHAGCQQTGIKMPIMPKPRQQQETGRHGRTYFFPFQSATFIKLYGRKA